MIPSISYQLCNSLHTIQDRARLQILATCIALSEEHSMIHSCSGKTYLTVWADDSLLLCSKLVSALSANIDTAHSVLMKNPRG